ncbi:MAG: FHA domain-containing protein [Chloroflexota bacterium]
MSHDERPTQRLIIKNGEIMEALIKQKNRELGTARLGKAREVILLIENGMRRLELRNETAYLLGRFAKSKPRSKHIDLTPFNGQERGISRIHAQIHMENDKLYLTDMDSTNGTYLDGVKLFPHQQKPLRQNSMITLGKLHIQVMYKSQTAATE